MVAPNFRQLKRHYEGSNSTTTNSTVKSKANVFKKEDTIKYFMIAYCYTKWWRPDEDCKQYLNKACHKQINYTKDCKEIGLRKFESSYDGMVCVKNFFTSMTVANRDTLETETPPEGDKYAVLKPTVVWGTLLSMLVMLVWKSNQNKVLSTKWDSEYTTDSDYSVLVKGLPNNQELKTFDKVNIKTILEKKLKAEGYDVTHMNFVYDTEEFLKLRQQYTNAKTKLVKNEFLGVQDGEDAGEHRQLVAEAPKEVEKLKKLISEQKARFDDSFGEGMVGAVFISFLTSDQARSFMSKHKERGLLYQMFRCFGYQNQPFEVTIPEDGQGGQGEGGIEPQVYKLYAEMPPEPGDVRWENQAYTQSQRFWRKIVVNILTLVVFIIGFMLLMGLKLAVVRF